MYVTYPCNFTRSKYICMSRVVPSIYLPATYTQYLPSASSENRSRNPAAYVLLVREYSNRRPHPQLAYTCISPKSARRITSYVQSESTRRVTTCTNILFHQLPFVTRCTCRLDCRITGLQMSTPWPLHRSAHGLTGELGCRCAIRKKRYCKFGCFVRAFTCTYHFT